MPEHAQVEAQTPKKKKVILKVAESTTPMASVERSGGD